MVIDIGKREFSSGLTSVTCSRVRQLQDLLFVPAVSFQTLASLANSQRLAQRKADQRLMHMHAITKAIGIVITVKFCSASYIRYLYITLDNLWLTLK